MGSLIKPATMREHRATWWVWSGGEKIRHTASMRGHWPGWDVACSCGWESREPAPQVRSVRVAGQDTRSATRE
jgi:hypothetical protein